MCAHTVQYLCQRGALTRKLQILKNIVLFGRCISQLTFVKKIWFVTICVTWIHAETSQRSNSVTDYRIVIRILHWLNIFLKKNPFLLFQCILMPPAVVAAGCVEKIQLQNFVLILILSSRGPFTQLSHNPVQPQSLWESSTAFCLLQPLISFHVSFSEKKNK